MQHFDLPLKNRPKNIVVLTGAGISQESGIRTFRAADGLWEDHRIEDVATPEGFARDPALVHRFYNARRQHLQSDDVVPNPAHLALAEFDQAVSGQLLVVTQNVDDLHDRAGQAQLIHMHGELLKARCAVSGHVTRAPLVLDESMKCDCCGLSETLRPDIVWFGEMPMEMDRIYQALSCADMFISIGTSGNVYPAAGFCREANQVGACTVELNLEPSSTSSEFQYTFYGPAGSLVPAFIDYLKRLPVAGN
ncbi:Sir2 family NAD+-dependent deacetylase [Corallincola spongiicola]|uniref:NAD-dependent protein deacylase n=1 Tax=Corallincola spongiicola TaxID=2520508 RepID=A0ABY1WU67_9GAMM|nr:Sir2 family NAD+-dependent deacetylase [Corallincola spongiicola]TAA48126.1 NAD-dependent protein deacylase [Corallincola spongiicola]